MIEEFLRGVKECINCKKKIVDQYAMYINCPYCAGELKMWYPIKIDWKD